MSGVLAQVKAFTLTLILGLLAGSIFHFYQLMIRRARVGKYLLYIIDFVLWIMMLVLVFIS
ncbi:MAG: spore cortex biosynthesis protein YabQ, partial [Syntrophomonas sp.]